MGGDPALDKKTARAEGRNTFGAVVDKYLEMRKATHRPSTHIEVKRYLQDYAKPLHNLPIKSVGRKNVAYLLDEVAARGTVTSNRMRSSLSAVFTWAMRRGLVDNNPVIGTERPAEKSRDRVLSDSELGIIWNAAPDDDFGAIVKLLILSAQRRDEISALCWSEIDFNNDVILLPAERCKNKRAHEVPLSGPMRAILSVHKRIEGRDLIFGKRDVPIAGWGWRKERLDAMIGDKIKTPWTLHDLRRSAATGLANIGTPPHLVEEILNHSKGRIASIYNKSMYRSEKADALRKWADHITAVTGGRDSNVAPLRGRG